MVAAVDMIIFLPKEPDHGPPDIVGILLTLFGLVMFVGLLVLLVLGVIQELQGG